MKDEQKYRKLLVYKKATTLVLHVYALLKKFPKEEQYALCDQLRRSVVSIPSNIAEGMGRISEKDRAHFLEIAYGSLMEVNCQLDVANRLDYITNDELKEMDEECVELARMLSGLRASILSKEGSGELRTKRNSRLSTLDS